MFAAVAKSLTQHNRRQSGKSESGVGYGCAGKEVPRDMEATAGPDPSISHTQLIVRVS